MEASIFNNLRRGDVVRYRRSEQSYIVQGNFGTHVIATDAVNISNPEEWNLILKANQNRINQVPEQDNESKGFDSNYIREKKTAQNFLCLDDKITLLSKQIDTIAGNIDVTIKGKDRQMASFKYSLVNFGKRLNSLQNRVADLDGMGGC